MEMHELSNHINDVGIKAIGCFFKGIEADCMPYGETAYRTLSNYMLDNEAFISHVLGSADLDQDELYHLKEIGINCDNILSRIQA